ncbi:hypothetical protein HFO29_01715 [Rhizobium laguerreae]|nr:hypothetical protein [Rhizobium laguerreae]MBY3116694.1 hypothetical protein [Rhizobium laguerreae]MBY3187914.1 hypothetical protein [Rhizobium laguerreae]
MPVGIPAPALAENVLERAIAQSQPCRSLRTKVKLGPINVDVGVDKLEAVKVESIQISVNGNVAEADARGTIACKTSDQAVVTGGFSATATVHLKTDLSTCAVDESAIAIVKTDGRFGDLVDGFKNQISDALRQGLEKNLKKLCEN